MKLKDKKALRIEELFLIKGVLIYVIAIMLLSCKNTTNFYKNQTR